MVNSGWEGFFHPSSNFDWMACERGAERGGGGRGLGKGGKVRGINRYKPASSISNVKRVGCLMALYLT